MGLQRRGAPGEVTLTACPFCDEPIATTESFSYHWPRCPENPEGEDR